MPDSEKFNDLYVYIGTEGVLSKGHDCMQSETVSI